MKYKTKLALAAVCGVLLSIGCWLYSIGSGETVTVLMRPECGSGSREELLRLELDGKEYSFSVLLQETPWSEDQVEKCLQEAAKELESLMLNGNPDCMTICEDLYFPSSYADTPIEIQWYLDSWEYVDPDGAIHNYGLEEPVIVQIQAILAMEDQTLNWEREIQLCPLEQLNADQMLEVLEVQLQQVQTTSEAEYLGLPQEVMGKKISWKYPKDDRWIWIFVLTLAALTAVVIGHRKDEEKERKLRERSMELDYAEIVSRLSLYMGAGISTRKAWERIVGNYGKKNGQKETCRPAYEEMRTTLYEMQSGIPETIAYERFGARCRMPSYLKLGTLLSQNLRKGTKGLAELLQEESRDAFQNRKAMAKKLGEECESKLLLPMLMMLLTVLIIVMYPALVSFQM